LEKLRRVRIREYGQLSLPAEIRDTLPLVPGDEVMIVPVAPGVLLVIQDHHALWDPHIAEGMVIDSPTAAPSRVDDSDIRDRVADFAYRLAAKPGMRGHR